MCGPYAAPVAQSIISAATQVGKTIVDYKQQEKNNEYRSQVAVNNIKSAQNEAQNQIQLGINKSREEKIEGIKRASAILAQNASSNTNALSDSNLINLQDIQNISYTNAQDILDNYKSNADKYYQKANNYLANYNQSQKIYKNSLAKSALNSLGTYSKVASNWFPTDTEGEFYDFI